MGPDWLQGNVHMRAESHDRNQLSSLQIRMTEDGKKGGSASLPWLGSNPRWE